MKKAVKRLLIIFIATIITCTVLGCGKVLSDELTEYNYKTPKPSSDDFPDYRARAIADIKNKYSGELIESKSNSYFRYSVYENGVQIDGTVSDNVTSLAIPEKIDGVWVIGIGEEAFCDRNDIKTLVIPSSVKYMGHSAFRRCKNLESVLLSEGLEYVASHVFDTCTSVKEIVFPNTVKSIGIYACALSGVENISIPENMTYVPDGMYYGSMVKEFKLSDKITYICGLAFAKCERLEEVIVPSTVEIIGHTAFANCINLERVVIEEGCKEMSFGIFEGCIGLEEVHLPSSVELYSTSILSDTNKKLVVYVKKNSKMEEFAINAKLNYVEE